MENKNFLQNIKIIFKKLIYKRKKQDLIPNMIETLEEMRSTNFILNMDILQEKLLT